MHTAFAAAIWSSANPVVPTGKNKSGSVSRQAATVRQSVTASMNGKACTAKVNLHTLHVPFKDESIGLVMPHSLARWTVRR